MRQCRKCGCTDNNACIDAYGNPCFWVEQDLCSECAGDDYELLVECGWPRKTTVGEFKSLYRALSACYQEDKQEIIQERK